MLGISSYRGFRAATHSFKTSRSCVLFRTYADTSVPQKKKKSQQSLDITQVPIKLIGVMADFYVPPKLLSCPVTSWHRLIARRIGAFAINTYSVVKYRQETGLKLKFNDWKEQAMERFVKTNKVFAAACNLPLNKREEYLRLQLDGIAGSNVLKNLAKRAKTFPINGKLTWELVSIDKNPRIVVFTTIPDSNNISAYVQFTIKVTTTQKVSFKSSGAAKDTERKVTDNLVYTMDPFSNEIVLVGTLFDSNHIRGVQPEINYGDTTLLQEFQEQSSDIFRSNPAKQEA